MKVALPLLFSCLFFTSCAGSNVMVLKPAVARPADCELPVFASESEVGRKFETVCIVEGRTGTAIFGDTSAAGALNQAKPSLCACGADAGLVVSSSSSQHASGLFTGPWTPVRDIRGNIQVRGIRFTE